MYYVAFIIVCSLNPGFIGDQDSGATCRKFSDQQDVGYVELRACERRVEDMEEEILADRNKLSRILPGPYWIRGFCRYTITDKVVV